MKALKIVTLSLLVALTASPAVAGGLGLGAVLHDFDDFGVQARTNFGLGGDISEITGGFSWYFDRTWFAFDADYHFILKDGATRFYPLAGLQLATDFSDWTEFGINLGGGMDFKMTDTKPAYAEAKFVIGDIDGLHLTLGLKF